MAHQPSPVVVQPVSRPSLLDLVCVVVLGTGLWATAQGVGAVARSSTVHPASTPHGAAAADCAAPAPEPTVAQASPLAPATGECGAAGAPASPAH